MAQVHLPPRSVDGAVVDVGSAPKHAGAPCLTLLSMALAGGRWGCAELLLAMGAILDRALEGLAYGLTEEHHIRTGACGDLACRLLMRVSPALSPWTAVNLVILLKHPGLTGAALRRLVEAFPAVGDFEEGIQEILGELEDSSRGLGPPAAEGLCGAPACALLLRHWASVHDFLRCGLLQALACLRALSASLMVSCSSYLIAGATLQRSCPPLPWQPCIDWQILWRFWWTTRRRQASEPMLRSLCSSGGGAWQDM